MLASFSNSYCIVVVLVGASHDNDASLTQDEGLTSNVPCIFIVKFSSTSLTAFIHNAIDIPANICWSSTRVRRNNFSSCKDVFKTS